MVIWRGRKDGLVHFLERLNNADPNIKFTWCIDAKEVNYLDIEIYNGPRFSETGYLDTRTHIKDKFIPKRPRVLVSSPYGILRGRHRRSHQTQKKLHGRRRIQETSLHSVRSSRSVDMDTEKYRSGPVPFWKVRDSVSQSRETQGIV